MPIGKEVGSVSMKGTSITKGVDAAGHHTFVLNLEGTVTGGWTGTVIMTMNITTSDNSSGTYTASAVAYLADGSVIPSSGSGLTRALGGHKWRLNGLGLLADGTQLAIEGDMELATRSFNAKLHEIT